MADHPIPMDYSESLKYLAELGQELQGVKFSLDAISQILGELRNPHELYSTAIVAGTNGKGSTCAMLASILTCAGYRTGLYTSPHLVRVNERMCVDRLEVSDADFAAAFTEVVSAVERLVSLHKLEKPPSFFEFLTATAFLHFAKAEANFVVLEVGMGGRLDATNVTNPRIAVITNIDFDHTEFLGSSLAAIAAEKAGIIRPRRPVLSGAEDPEAAGAIRRRAKECGAELLEMKDLVQITRLRANRGCYSFDMAIGEDRLAGLTCPLLGKFQVKNAAAAVTAAWRLRAGGLTIPRRSIFQGLWEASWPGRLERIASKPLVLLDGGHNPGAAREIATFIREELPGRCVRLVYGSMRDKAIREICESLFPLAAEVYLTHPEHARAATTEEILAALSSRPAPHQDGTGPALDHYATGQATLHVEPEPVRALERALNASSPHDVVLVVGSLYLVGAVKKAQREGKLQLPDSREQ